MVFELIAIKSTSQELIFLFNFRTDFWEKQSDNESEQKKSTKNAAVLRRGHESIGKEEEEGEALLHLLPPYHPILSSLFTVCSSTMTIIKTLF